jgi:hypothetical protein
LCNVLEHVYLYVLSIEYILFINMNSIKNNSKEKLFTLALSIVVGVLVVMHAVSAATTISTDIQTDGNLSVTGQSLFTGTVSIATTTSTGSLNVAGPYGGNAVVIDQQNPVTDITARPAILISNSDTTANNYALLGFTTTTNGQPAAKVGAVFSNRASNYADLVFGTRNVSGMNEVMRATSGGNIGIGTSTPWGKISITGSGTGTSNDFVFADSNNAPKVVITDNGNVGIGTTTPTTPFMIQSDNYPQFQIVNHADQGLEIHPWFGLNYVDIDPVQNGATVLFGDNQTAATWSFMSGNMGIGTTTPTGKVEITSGTNATTTVTVGELNMTSSKSCVNMNASDGSASSFYINAAHTMVVEAHYCR